MIKITNCAPVLVVVYDRLEHFKKCIDSLMRCPESSGTTLYIASDAAFCEEHEKNIKDVRDYIYYLVEHGAFEKVVPIIREKNFGAIDNTMDARRFIYRENETLIQMEDDVVVSPRFLKFINEGLTYYADNKNVVAVCGFVRPELSLINNEVNFLYDRAPYGYGVWRLKEQFLEKKRTPEFAVDCLKNTVLRNTVLNKLGYRLTDRIYDIAYKGFLAEDIQTALVLATSNLYAVYPPKALSKTIGNDGTGLNASVDKTLVDMEVYDDLVWTFSSASVIADRERQKALNILLGGYGFTILFKRLSMLLIVHFPCLYDFYINLKNKIKRN